MTSQVKAKLTNAFWHPRFGLVLFFVYMGVGWIDRVPSIKSEDDAARLLAHIRTNHLRAGKPDDMP